MISSTSLASKDCFHPLFWAADRLPPFRIIPTLAPPPLTSETIFQPYILAVTRIDSTPDFCVYDTYLAHGFKSFAHSKVHGLRDPITLTLNGEHIELVPETIISYGGVPVLAFTSPWLLRGQQASMKRKNPSFLVENLASDLEQEDETINPFYYALMLALAQGQMKRMKADTYTVRVSYPPDDMDSIVVFTAKIPAALIKTVSGETPSLGLTEAKSSIEVQRTKVLITRGLSELGGYITEVVKELDIMTSDVRRRMEARKGNSTRRVRGLQHKDARLSG